MAAVSDDSFELYDLRVEVVAPEGAKLYCGAKPGDRTMLDTLFPALEAWRSSGWSDAVRSARAGADATANLYPRLGRASYLGERAIGAPDGGAVAVAIWMRAIADALAE